MLHSTRLLAAEQRQVASYQERERIASTLDDAVIHRVFAIELTRSGLA